MKRKTVAVWLLFASLAGCSDIVGSSDDLEIDDARKYFIDPTFRIWWRDLEKCSGLTRQLGAIKFYWVPGTTLPTTTPNKTVVGRFYAYSNRIFVIESHKKSPDTVRHEMMHALLRNADGHPPEYFGETSRCGVL